MATREDEMYMAEALKLAGNARGRTSPNPLVGAVVVREGRIVGQGWHRKAGTPHAEVHALNMAGELARGATVYVTLEPCSHYGRTGPCAKALVEAGVKRVVVAMIDPNPKVAGKGVKILEEAGIQVEVGVGEEEAKRLNRSFLKWITTGKPYVIMKTAMSLDGKIASCTGQSQWITNEKSRQLVHELRDVCDGILVGINTVLKDNPSLTARLPDGNGKNPIRVVLDSRARIPLDSRLVTDGQAPLLVAVSQEASPERIAALQAAGAEVITAGENRININQLLTELGKRQMTSLLVEGGGQVNFSFLQAGAADEVYAFVAPMLIGGREALTPVEGAGFAQLASAVRLQDVSTEMLEGDILIKGYVDKAR